MANDNNDINTDELTAGSSSAASSSACSATSKGAAAAAPSSSIETSESASEQQSAAPAPAEVPRREENPFSFKHFLKWDGPLSSGGSGGGGGGSGTSSHNHHTSNGGGTVGTSGGIASISTNGSINHSRSTSNINGHGTISNDGERMSADALLVSGAGNDTSGFAIPASLNATTSSSSSVAGTGSPSKSATTSSLHVVSSTTTGARPKIPQFQSVNTLSSESKMKRSPRFPSFDSQSSLSDFAADELRFSRPGGGGGGGSNTGGGSGIYTSRSNSSFCSGRLRDGERIGDDSLTGVGGYVQRSYSHYDIDPDSPDRDGLVGDGIGAVEDDDRVGSCGRLVGASAEFSAALPDFVQDHLVMEQWYNTLPKGAGSRSASGSGGPVLAEFEHGLGDSVGRGDVQPALLNDMPFDLTGSIGGAGAGRSRATGTLPLDLDPATGNAGIDRTQRRITPTPSADLPPDLTEGGANGGNLDPGSGIGGPYYYPGGQSPPLASAASAGTADKIHRLPDFLSDGPIHSSGRLADVTHDTPHGTGSDERASHHRLQQQQQQQQQQHQQQQHQRELHYQNRLEMEQMVNERLRRELDSSRRTVGEQSRRIRELERDLETMVSLAGPQQSHHHHSLTTTSGSSGSTQSNANSFMLAKSRAATAEAEVQRLKQKLAGMSAELETLRRENERLKECEGAIGGTGAGASALPRGSPNSPHQTSRFLRSQTLALRQAAASAENNLRQLLSGVENLRSMANEIESFNGTFSPGTHGEGSGTRIGASISETYHHRAGDDGNNDGDGDDDDDDDDDDDEGDDDALGPAL
ncbi:uncharacterized transmembrane protein DDB_G0289901 [Anopheles darlingi]|uniref:uncharacterized transmembrane protein DDB_G0289901 n=1 Tax=Anopheles darlingi TaxID=43151 RepID=UPI0021000462|nr:uncharacterized transmembrane protein DDB_G0289901 [Anopheles darlingi]XP_049546758.1 uncharacterized transmembrane protein DDB_G0289901 [Anopheles darlingi]XP_049546759.1 uncharacterized transmembrane protein DDB_G0289901 [Anopheles darlingi]